jgi:serine/threonine-protein kinase HipA
METVPSNTAAARAAGFDVIDAFELPEQAWWDFYYAPLLDRVKILRPRAAEASALAAAIAETEREIELYRRFGRSYGYVFYLMRAA